MKTVRFKDVTVGALVLVEGHGEKHIFRVQGVERDLICSEKHVFYRWDGWSVIPVESHGVEAKLIV